jgi:hypothetical protein
MRVDRESRISRHIRSNVLGLVAIFMALGGTAYATHPDGANTISSGDIIDGQVQNPDLGPSSVTTDKVASSTLTGSDVATGGLFGSDLATDTVTSSDIATGAISTNEFSSSIPAARVTHASGQVVPNATAATLSFDSERYDTAAMHSTSSNTSRLTAPVTGIYEVTANVRWSGAQFTAGASTVTLRKNGSGLVAWEEDAGNDANLITTTARLAAGDYLEVVVSQTSGSSKTIGSLAEYSPEFSMTWLTRVP